MKVNTAYRIIILSMFLYKFICLLVLLACFKLASAAPGDTIYLDDFQDGTLAAWTTTDGALSGVNNDTSTTGEGGAGQSMFTNGGDVTVTSPAINTAGVGGVQLTAWVRKGDDAFSEDPDTAAENLVLEYLTSTGFWVSLQTFDASNATPDGQIFNPSFLLNSDALHAGFQIRFQQLGGSGAPFDFWHIDDVTLIETATSPPPQAPLNLGICEELDSLTSTPWVIVGNGLVETNALAPALDGSSMSIFSDTVSVTSPVMDTTLGFAGVQFDVQEGDGFSERPDNNEDLIVEYLNSANTWVELGAGLYRGNNGAPAGTFYDDQTYLTAPPANAQHANFQLRFRLTDSSGGGTRRWDFWHIDDICILAVEAVLAVEKTVSVEQDTVNGTTAPKAIPGAYNVYTIAVSDTVGGFSDPETLSLTDVLPEDVSLFVGNFNGTGSPFSFVDGAPASGIGINYTSLNSTTDDVDFLDAGGSILLGITPDADGFAPAVRQIRINSTGRILPNGSFDLSYRVRQD